MNVARSVPFLALAVIVVGCASQRNPPAGGGTQSNVRYDGHYDGTVQVTGVLSGGNTSWCETDQRLSLQVSDNKFSYTQPHPNVPVAMADRATVVYTASIAPDGAITGTSSTNARARESRSRTTTVIARGGRSERVNHCLRQRLRSREVERRSA